MVNKTLIDESRKKYLIKRYLKTQESANKAGKEMELFFIELITPRLEIAKTKENFHDIKNMLREMPESFNKVLIFRRILMTEEERGIITS